eukprot:TRINITY_DN1165_c0_g1_i1.p1 TRINITY_DN1165_c0_g1~~TRINITY_DN1165_c0_g1_i1.p1  ORF type:complete len:166 (-),score=10.71 TRINITY_DN1165_c0_g1_i1:29-526(-)
MRITRFVVVAIIAGLFSINVSAQTDHLAIANLAYDGQEYYKAITLLKKAYSKEKDKANKAEIIYKTAECYRFVNDLKQAETWYRKALKIKYPENKIQLYYADALKANGKFEDATAEYENCLLYTSDAADDLLCVDLGGRRIIKKKNPNNTHYDARNNTSRETTPL